MFEIEKNISLKVHKCKMKCDTKISDDIPDPLPSESFAMVVAGSPGSGKSSLVTSIISAPKSKQGIRQSYVKLFEHIIVCSPSLDSLSNNIYADLDATKKHTSFNEDFMNFLDEHLDKATSEDEVERT